MNDIIIIYTGIVFIPSLVIFVGILLLKLYRNKLFSILLLICGGIGTTILLGSRFIIFVLGFNMLSQLFPTLSSILTFILRDLLTIALALSLPIINLKLIKDSTSKDSTKKIVIAIYILLAPFIAIRVLTSIGAMLG